ncbi:MAG: hypothetical protein J7J33_04995, partial [Caldisericia bacterium]|nr:hypothetical protein [Caldisericia bacterium]
MMYIFHDIFFMKNYNIFFHFVNIMYNPTTHLQLELIYNILNPFIVNVSVESLADKRFQHILTFFIAFL